MIGLPRRFVRCSAGIVLITLGACCYAGVGENGGASTGATGVGTAGTGASGTAGSTGATQGGASTGTTTGTICPGYGPASCLTDSDCACGQACVLDPALYFGPICEPRCTSDADCPNAVTACALEPRLFDGGSVDTCAVRGCRPDAGPGAPCAIGASGDPAQPYGTCVPLEYRIDNLETGALICVPNGSAATCVEGTTSDDPFFGLTNDGGGAIPAVQPDDPSEFCGAGEACYADLGAPGQPGECAELCTAPGDAGSGVCVAPNVCVLQFVSLSPRLYASFGFCLPCVSSGSDGGAAGLCLADSDYCDGSCGARIYGGGAALYGLCQPAN